MRRPRREQNSILLNGMASPAGVDLTNDYATGLGTKLDYGFALAGGHTSDEPAYFAPLLELSLPPYRWRPVSSMTTPDASPVPELDCRAATEKVPELIRLFPQRFQPAREALPAPLATRSTTTEAASAPAQAGPPRRSWALAVTLAIGSGPAPGTPASRRS